MKNLKIFEKLLNLCAILRIKLITHGVSITLNSNSTKNNEFSSVSGVIHGF
jgi:hypothetical protein